MRILLSAYACEPDKGSEPGVGWHWCLELASRGHEVWVITRANNQHNIECALEKMPALPNLHFAYYDLPAWARWWKRGSRLGFVNFYYALWQWGAYRTAKKLCQTHVFDLVHHITFGVFRQPSFMGRLGIPFVFGPVGGGERTPLRLRKNYSLRAHLLDFFRDVLNFLSRFDPLLQNMFDQAKLIYVKTPMTGRVIPAKFQHKTHQLIEIGINDRNEVALPVEVPNVFSDSRPMRFLYVGHFFSLKGMQLAFPALARLLSESFPVQLTMVGKGGEESRWKSQVEALGISHCVDWITWISQTELFEIYRQHDALLFPSLHDSSGNVLLESMSFGLPVICLDLGGPGVIVNNQCGMVVKTAGKSADEVTDALYQQMKDLLMMDLQKRIALREGAFSRVREFSWRKAVERVYETDLKKIIG